MKRARLESLLRDKIRLKITKGKRGSFLLALCVNGVVLQSEPAPNKRHAFNALVTRLRCMPVITIEIRSTAARNGRPR